jgi:signal transduction histidine kinase
MDTKLQPDKTQTLLYLLGFVLLLLTVITIPMYYIFQNEFEKNFSTKMNTLQHYAQTRQTALLTNSHRSLLFFSALYIDNTLVQASTQNLFCERLNQVVSQDSGYFFYKHRIDNNSVLVVATTTGEKVLYIKMALAILGAFIFLLLATWMLFKMVVAPYEKINRYLDAFFNDAMHELKTPIGVIQFNLELLEQKEPGKKEVKRAMNGIKGLQFIYEDIEYLIKHKRIDYKRAQIDFSSMLFHRIDFFNSFAKAKRITVVAKIQEHIYLSFNKIELQRVIDNTLSNAIKYSCADAKIEIRLYTQQNRAVFQVKDYGKGISDTKKIFQRYHREDQNKGGFGIGLNIVKTICDKYGVTIDVQSEVKKGSTFSYEFMPPVYEGNA